MPSTTPSVSSQPSVGIMPSCSKGKGDEDGKRKLGKGGGDGIASKGKIENRTAAGSNRTASKAKSSKGNGGHSCDKDEYNDDMIDEGNTTNAIYGHHPDSGDEPVEYDVYTQHFDYLQEMTSDSLKSFAFTVSFIFVLGAIFII
jgi:hypothetical protein